MESRTSILTNGVIWFGVAISVSEIQAGIGIGTMSSLDSLWLPLILGHIIGGILLFLVGYIGAKLRKNAMETTKSTFGKYGFKFFALLNVLQLIAWIAVLNAQGATALAGLNLPISFPITCLILASFIAIWVYVGLQRSSKITTIIMIVLTILLIIMTIRFFGFDASKLIPLTNSTKIATNTLSFWNIFEISIAMPISWLPVISDYTKDVKKPIVGTLVSATSYTIASLWMYFIGIEIACIGTNDIAQAILITNLGTAGVIIMVLSTITTNFLAANSSGESAKAIYNKLNPKVVGVIVSFLSALLAISGIMDHYINFLYLIASVFAPMAAVLLVSFYIGEKSNKKEKLDKDKASDKNENPYKNEKLDKDEKLDKNENSNLNKNINENQISWKWNIMAWFIGFITYQLAGYLDSIFLGPTLLAILVSALLTYMGLIIKKRNILKNS